MKDYKKIAQTSVEKMAKDLVSVQPMPSDCIKNLKDVSKSEDELTAEGYKPVSRLGLLWSKK